MNEDYDFLTVTDLALLMKVSERTIYRMLQHKKIPFAQKISGCWRFNKQEVKSWGRT